MRAPSFGPDRQKPSSSGTLRAPPSTAKVPVRCPLPTLRFSSRVSLKKSGKIAHMLWPIRSIEANARECTKPDALTILGKPAEELSFGALYFFPRRGSLKDFAATFAEIRDPKVM